MSRLSALRKVPTAQLITASQDGPNTVKGTAQLAALGAIPNSDLATLQDAASAAARAP